jgi:hypothetical protein
MTNVDCGELLAQLHIPVRSHTEEMKWFISTHLDVKASDNFILADLWLNSNSFSSSHHKKLPGYDQCGL